MKLQKIQIIFILTLILSVHPVKAGEKEKQDTHKLAIQEEIYERKLGEHEPPNSRAGIITKLEGPSYIRRPGVRIGHCVGHCVSEKDWNHTALGMHVFENDVLYTEDEGRVQVQFGVNRTNLKLSKNSEVQFEKSTPELFVATVRRGSLHFQAQGKKKEDLFILKTVHGIIRAVGDSEFYILQTKDFGDITVSSVRGSIEIISSISNVRTRMNGNQNAKIRPSGAVDIL